MTGLDPIPRGPGLPPARVAAASVDHGRLELFPQVGFGPFDQDEGGPFGAVRISALDGQAHGFVERQRGRRPAGFPGHDLEACLLYTSPSPRDS